MKIKIDPFKMRVTPEESVYVQQILLENGYCWATGLNGVKLIRSPFFFFDGRTMFAGQNTLAYFNDVPELKFWEFTKYYEAEAEKQKLISGEYAKRWVGIKDGSGCPYVVPASDGLEGFTKAEFEKALESFMFQWRPVSPPKKYFHSFEHENRLITLCVYGGKIGYSVKLPDDPLDRELGKKISLGRALKCPIGEFTLDKELGKDKGVLKSIAIHWEKKIKKDVKKYIKGIR